MIPAQFFDGKTPKAREAEVLILGSYLVIQVLVTKEEFKIDVASLEVGHQDDFVVLSNSEIEVHLTKENYLRLGHKPSFLGRDKGPLMRGILIASSCLIVLSFFYRPLLEFTASLIPDSFFESSGKQLTEIYRPQHCLNADQEKSLQDVFARLGKNYSSYKVFVIKSPLVNAFVMPGNLIIIHDELLKTSPSPEAVAGIISHEMAHVEGEHIKIGHLKHYLVETFSVFVLNKSVASGLFKQLTQGLFTQEEERRADEMAAANLKDQHIDPKGIVEFFKQLHLKDPGYLKYLIFTHPEYPERIKVFSQVYDSYPVLSAVAWKTLQAGCK
jgi:Zn-dependent protease with chaperone function